ncbi:competence protein ComK [Paenibacillus sp. BSR1-1]|uniref:competence protein ComK n=1 Tax=Paenibacillus sp. BSR1-1 TaxID=3020845 RepID=UPI0025AFF17F|nr:competence protein ComK [Paenibacillus sp. BSR1-1]MDN3015136.1 competence protein ComK [Paenibacillus sp. BSR1-1]
MKEQQIEEYEISSCTMFLKPVVYGSKIYSQIYEVEDCFLSPFKPLDIIKNSCDYFGVDYESRKRGTRKLTGYNRKNPIAIEPTNHIFFFPTASPSIPECIWLSQAHIKDYRRSGANQTLITFHNKQSYLFPVSCSTIETQLLRTALLKSTILQRIELKGRKLTYLLHVPKTLQASESTHEYAGKFSKGEE